MKKTYPWLLIILLSMLTLANITRAAQTNLTGPAGSRIFGNAVTVLPNGNFVVTDPGYDAPGPVNNVGAAHLYDGATLALISTLTGSAVSDLVGNGGITVLTNGNYVVRSSSWNGNRGAATFCSSVTGCSGIVSSANSLIGSTANDQVCNFGITALTNGNYVISSPNWNGNRGAATWGNGTSGISGVVSSSNSLIGSTANDQVGSNGITALTNGNYVVRSPNWDNPSPAITDVGAATWGNGTSGVSGVISASNSVVGLTTNNSVGNGGVVALTNGNYVVRSLNWDNGGINDVGAATWGNGTSGTSGAVTSSNSLVGSMTNDFVGNGGITALTNGNYVVSSYLWDNGATGDTGAATWGNGTTGTAGAVSSANSLVGLMANDNVGRNGVTALTNGNYVVSSYLWDNGATGDTGAVTWGNGASGTSGAVTSGNSLVGLMANDNVGINGVTALTNGNYVVSSYLWDNGATGDTGAATWGNGTTGTVGAVSSANSLVGLMANDNVGNGGITALTNGNYVVRSILWDNGATGDTGAVTWGNGATGTSGAVSSINSLVGTIGNDNVGNGGVIPLTNGNYVVNSQNWDNPSPAVVNASAFTFGNGASGTSGAITSGTGGGNSVVGTIPSGTNAFAFDAARNRLVVGRQNSNIVSILSFTTTAIADGDLNNPANWSSGVPNGLLTGIIPSGRAMTISSLMNIGQIQVQCGGSLTGGSASAYIVGSVHKDFCAAAGETFLYPLGDAVNYSPLTASNVNGTGALTAAVTDNFLPGLPQTKSLSRFWSLTGAGITTNLTFQYVDADINGSEASYKIYKRSSSTNLTVLGGLSTSNLAANTITTTNISQFSDWSAGDGPLAPTAANVSISGRVLVGKGAGLRNAIVSLTKSNGETVTARTTTFGYYQLDGIAAGQTVIISVNSKQYQFAPQVIDLTDNLTDVNFIALE